MAWLYQRKDSALWWIGYRENGTQLLKSTGTADKKAAEAQLARLDAMIASRRANALTMDFFQALTGKTVAQMTLKAALADWLNEARGATGKRTLERYQAFAASLEAYFKANDQGPLVSEIERAPLQQFLSQKRAGVSATTANMARKCLSIFFRRCKNIGAIRDNPTEAIKAFKAGRGEQQARRAFTAAEMASLYRVAPDPFWRYMVLAGFFTGLRLGDLATMPIGAVDFTAKTINIRTRKTDTVLHIPIAPPLFETLKALKAERKDAAASEPFWPEQAKRYEAVGPGWFSQRFYDLLLIKAGLAKARPHRPGTKTKADKRKVNEVSFHCFRHAYVSTLAALGQNQQIVKALAGHSSDEISDLYTHIPPEVLRNAVALLPDITKELK